MTSTAYRGCCFAYGVDSMGRRGRFTTIICVVTAVLMGAPAYLQGRAWAQSAPTSNVTVFTDGLAYPDGVISKAVAELSAELEKSRKVRLLSIMGNAGPANLRDLLRFRGVDFAILNSDVLASPDVAKSYPGLGDKIRYVTKLRGQKVILLVRPDVEDVGRLAGKKLVAFGPDGVTGFTARTVLAVLGVKAEVAPRYNAAESELTQADAILLFDTDLKRLPPEVARSGDFRPVAIPMNPALAKFYRAAQIQPAELGAAPDEPAIDTVEIDTILASFNWLPQHGRYADVTAFIGSFFTALPQLRANHPSSIWNGTDPGAPVLGWRQFGPAAVAAKSVPAPAAPAPALASPPGSEDADGNAGLRLSIVPQSPLTEEHGSGGGLLTQLAKAALERTDWPQAADVKIRWEKDRASQAHALLVEKRADLALPWSGPSCDEPAQLTGETAAICDGALASDPIFKALVVFFAASGSDFDPTSQERLSGRTLCAPANRASSAPTEIAARLIQNGQLKLLRPPSLIDCLNLVGRGDADALIMNELEGKRAIANLGLSQAFRVIENAGSTEEMRIVVAKSVPKAEELLNALNKGIAKLKTEDVYGEIVMKHVIALSN